MQHTLDLYNFGKRLMDNADRGGGQAIRAALRYQVGLMIVHSTQKHAFIPGEIALLQTFANHAAVAIQRAGLIQELLDRWRPRVGQVTDSRQRQMLDVIRRVRAEWGPLTSGPHCICGSRNGEGMEAKGRGTSAGTRRLGRSRSCTPRPSLRLHLLPVPASSLVPR